MRWNFLFSNSLASTSKGLHLDDSTKSNQHKVEMDRVRDILEKLETSGGVDTATVPVPVSQIEEQMVAEVPASTLTGPQSVLASQMRQNFR